MRALLWIALAAGCEARAQPPRAQPPDLRGAVGALAGARMCELLRDSFHAVPRAGAAGALWLRACAASAEGDEVALRLEGDGCSGSRVRSTEKRVIHQRRRTVSK